MAWFFDNLGYSEKTAAIFFLRSADVGVNISFTFAKYHTHLMDACVEYGLADEAVTSSVWSYYTITDLGRIYLERWVVGDWSRYEGQAIVPAPVPPPPPCSAEEAW